jgi:hypothetical protein
VHVSLRLSRNGRPQASGTGKSRHTIHLQSTRKLSRGVYAVTLVIGGRTVHGKVRVR